MRSVIWAQAAIRDLRDFERYLREYDPAVAQVQVDRLVLATYWLLENPKGGPRYGRGGRRKWTPPGQKIAVLLYRPTAQGILLLRVRYPHSNWRRSR